MAWQTMPFSRGSYSCYLPGQWRFWGTEGQRVHNVHFAGEHTSLEFQGYMEGAAESGARVAGEIMDDLGLAPSDVHGALLAFERGLPPARTSTPCLGQRRRARQELLALLVDTTNA
jgi:Flavin containing amine oxidoreductase